MKKLRIGRRRGRGEGLALTPLELALYPALDEGRWQVPDRFNFTRDVVEALADDPKRRAVTFIGKDGIIEPRTFHSLAERSARWSWLLRERGVRPGDPVLVLAGTNVDWLEIVLACLKVGAVVVPGSPNVTAETLDVRVARTGAELMVAEPVATAEIGRMLERPQVLYVDEGRGLLDTVAEHAPTHDSTARDIAFILTTAGTASGGTRLVGHSHGSVFSARVAAEHWLDAGRGDAVWSPADAGSATAIWHALIGPWSRGAETLMHDGPFEPLERLDLIYRLGVTVLCQSPAEYASLAELREVQRLQPPQLRRLVSTGDYLDPDVSAVFEEAWGLTIHDAYGQTETGVVVANGGDAGFKPGAIGLPLPGQQVAVIDDQGNELPPGIEGELAVRGRPPTLFAGYWESPDETKQAFRGDWYVTGDIATVDQEGFFWFVARESDVITSRGERFGPHETERALRAHDAVTTAAVVGVRDLERGGQFVRAFVVLAPRVKESDQLEAELRHEVGQSLADHAIPREIEFVEELPTAPGGKIRRLELRERLVVGRPLWDMPPTSESEVEPDRWGAMLAPWPPPEEPQPAPDLAPSQEALPDYIVPPTPPPEPAVEPVVPPEPEPVVEASAPVVEPVVEPVLEPLPDYVLEPRTAEPAAEPAPAAEAAHAVEPEPEAMVEPEPVPTLPEPIAEATHEPPTQPDTEPPAPDGDAPPGIGVSRLDRSVLEPLPDWGAPLPNGQPTPGQDEPLPHLRAMPEPEVEPEPESAPEHVAEFEPVAEFQPEPLVALDAEVDIEPVALVEVEPDLKPDVEPDVEPEPTAEHVVEPDVDPDVDPEPKAPEAAWAPMPSLTPKPDGDAEPQTPPDFIVYEPSPEPEPPAEPEPTAASILDPEPDPGPLPDYIVDPEKPSERPVQPAPATEPPSDTRSTPPSFIIEPEPSAESPEPSLANLGLPPLTEFPGVNRERAPESGTREEPERLPSAQSRPEPTKKRGRRGRSNGEPGDEPEAVDWMDGLSSRLSAYSLAQEDAAPDAEQDEAEAGSDDPDK